MLAGIDVWPHAHPTERDRFAATIVHTDTCWVWTGGIESFGGYGRFRTPTGVIAAHRWSYHATHGHLPAVVRHTCDIRCCVRPDHLLGGTQADNLADRARRGARTGWVPDQPTWWPDLAYAIRTAARTGNHHLLTQLLDHPEQLTLF